MEAVHEEGWEAGFLHVRVPYAGLSVVGEDGEANHAFVSDNLNTVFLGGVWATKHQEPEPGRPESNLKQALIVSSASYSPPRLDL